jgi:hypothetical protein
MSISNLSFGNYSADVRKRVPYRGIGPVQYTSMWQKPGILVIGSECEPDENGCEPDPDTIYNITESLSGEVIDKEEKFFKITDSWKELLAYKIKD